MKIFYCHHAMRNKSNPPSQNDGLKDLGKEDASVVARLLDDGVKNGLKIKAIYSSPYFRCMETARLINEKIQVPIFEDVRFNEFEGVHKLVKGQMVDSGESWKDCQCRIISAIKDIVENYSNDDVVICVTSGVNISAFIALAYGVKCSDNLPYPLVPSCSLVGFDINENHFKK